MKNINYIVLAFILLNTLSFAQYKGYHSISDINSSLKSTLTTMELIRWPSGEERNFGVLIAHDIDPLNNKNYSYVLFSPTSSNFDANGIQELKLDYAAPLKDTELDFFIKQIELRLKNWGKNTVEGKGTFFEILTAPEHKIRRISENVDLWSPSIKFGFQDTSDGTISILYIGPESYKYSYEFSDKSELMAFYQVLKDAKNKLLTLIK